MKLALEKKVGYLTGITIFLIILNALSLVSNIEASTTPKFGNEIVLRGADGTIRYRIYLDEMENLVEEMNDKKGNTRIKRLVNYSGTLISSKYGTSNNGVDIEVYIDDSKPENQSSVSSKFGFPDNSGSVERSTLTLTSNDQKYPVYLTSAYDVGAMGMFGNINNHQSLVLRTGMKSTGLSVMDKKMPRIQLSFAKGLGAVMGVNNKSGNMTFASGVNDRNGKSSNFIKTTPHEDAWKIISNAMTLHSIWNLK